jgi:two-component system sensor histidine kinase BaeS
VAVRLFAAFFLGLLACGASLLAVQTLASGFSTISYVTLAGVALLLIVGVTVAVRGSRLLRGLIAPIDSLLETTDRLAAGDYQARAPVRGLPELRQLAATINGMAEQLERSAAERRGFFANVTHELRTPLTVLQGEVEGMIDGVHPANEERLRSVLEETRHLSHLVEDLRTLSLAEAGALQLRLEPTDLSDFLHETSAAFRSEAERAGIGLEVHADDGAPPAEIDPLRLREVLANLIVNALHASQPGDTIHLGYAHSDQGHLLTVADGGSGIRPQDLPTLFDRFTKSTGSDGSGLGLAIARELVTAHGGRIEVESEVGVGTTMRVVLPGKTR